jgi:DNA mismatch repair protein MutS2
MPQSGHQDRRQRSPGGEELDLHRLTVEEALPRLDELLYAAYQSGLYRVWVVHGKSTGILRREVGRHLANHPLVRSYGPADPRHGGIGATQVELREW